MSAIAVMAWPLLAALAVAGTAGREPTATIQVDAVLYRKHQVCLADVRGTAGRITAIHLVPSAKDREALGDLMVCLFWDGRETPFIACSLPELLALLDGDGRPARMPQLVFGEGFRIFLECVSGPGGRVRGHISYIRSASPVSSKRVRFDPDLGIGTPVAVETERCEPPATRPGRGEAIAIPNAGFESGTGKPWRDLSWQKGSFRIYGTGTEGVRAHRGRFMAGTVVPGEPTRGCKGLVRVGGLVPGYRYRCSAWVHTYNLDRQPAERPVPWNAKVRLGMNTTGTFLSELYPEGGDLWTVDFSHPRFYFAHCWGARGFADSQDHWSRISVEARARGEVASILLRAVQLYGHRGNRKWSFFDDAKLENVPIPMGRIRGRVEDGRGRPLRDVRVVTRPWGFGGRTGGDGAFEIEGVPEGIYAVEARYGGARTSIGGVRVLADRATALTFTFGDAAVGRPVREEPRDGRNLLINGGFESGDAAGWRRAYDGDAMGVICTTRRVVPASGRYMFGGEHVFHHAGAREVIYQCIPARRGSRWTFRGRLFAHSADGSTDGATCRLVADPSGGAAFLVASDEHNGPWRDVSVSFLAEADRVSVGVELRLRPRATGGIPGDEGIVGRGPDASFRSDYNACYCDDLCLVPAARAAAMTAPSRRGKRPIVASGAPPRLPDADAAVIVLPDGKTPIELIRIPGGRFLMGGDSRSGWARDDEFPRHEVRLDAYWIGKYEVTNGQYKAFCDSQGYPYPPDPAFSGVPWAHPERAYDYGDYFGRMPDHPVVNVSWRDAQAFCRWAGLRLPTEAEWEMAARGPGASLRTYPWGEQTDPAWTTRTRANTCIQAIPDWYLYTAPKGSFETGDPWTVGKSIFGVCAMGGNVHEWCADWYGPYGEGDEVNPKGPSAGTEKVLRGGCWRDRNYGVITRCSYRQHHAPNFYEWGTTGFRLAASAE